MSKKKLVEKEIEEILKNVQGSFAFDNLELDLEDIEDGKKVLNGERLIETMNSSYLCNLRSIHPHRNVGGYWIESCWEASGKIENDNADAK